MYTLLFIRGFRIMQVIDKAPGHNYHVITLKF